eukprot:6139594-Amphidinium_carterae.1
MALAMPQLQLRNHMLVWSGSRSSAQQWKKLASSAAPVYLLENAQHHCVALKSNPIAIPLVTTGDKSSSR